MEQGFFKNPQFMYRFATLPSRGPLRIPLTHQIMRQSSQMQKINEFMQKSKLKQNTSQTIQQVLKTYTRLINNRYSLNQRKAFMFEDSMMLYSWLLTNLNIDQGQIRRIINYIYDRYVFRDLPQAMGCIIGRLLIFRIQNQKERNQINTIIDRVYVLTKRDRSFCDMSKMMQMMLMGIWDTFEELSDDFMTFQGWEYFRGIQQQFEEFYQTTSNDFRQVWEEFLFNTEKHQHEVIELIKKVTDYTDCNSSQKSNKFACFIYILRFLINQHRYNTKFSSELIDTVDQVLCKICYIPLNKSFSHMNGFLILYKIVAKEKQLFEKGVEKIHMALRVSAEFFKQIIGRGMDIIQEFRHKINNETDFTKFYEQLDGKMDSVFELKALSENASQFLSYGAPFQSQKPSPYTEIYKQLHTPAEKKTAPLPQYKICQAIDRARPQILKYAQQKLANLQYLQLFISLQIIHQTFLSKIKELCKLVSDIELRHKYVKSLYTWYGAAFVKIMKHISEVKNLLRLGKFMSKDFIEQMHCELICRMTDLGMIELDFKNLYYVIFEDDQIDGTTVIEFDSVYFGMKDLFDIIERLGGNVGNATCYYELKKLRKYYQAFVMRGYGVSKDLKKEEAKQEMRKIVEHILKKKDMMLKRPQYKFVKTFQQGQKDIEMYYNDVMKSFKIEQGLEYPSNYDNKYHLIKTSIFLMLSKMQDNWLGKTQYHEVFVCVVTVLDHEELLLDIYANLMYVILSASNVNLVEWGYKSLGLMRRLLSDKWKSQLSCSSNTVKGMLCIFERIRKIQIKRNRRKLNFSKSHAVTNSSTGKTLSYREKEVQLSKIYERYFKEVFESDPLDSLGYGKQLASMRKYREATLILEIVSQKLKDLELRAEQGEMEGLKEIKLDKKQLDIKLAQCEMALCDCYAVMVPEFRDIQHITRDKCIKQKMDQSQKKHLKNVHQRLQEKSIQKQQVQQRKSLITYMSGKIQQQYRKIYAIKWLNKDENMTDFDMKRERELFMHLIFIHITNQSINQLSKVSTHEDFKVYYLGVIMAGLLYNWFEEKQYELDERVKQRELKMRQSSQIFEQQEEKAIGGRKIAPILTENGELEHEKQLVEISFNQLIRRNLSLISSPKDKLMIVQTMVNIQYISDRFNLQTIRMHYSALLQSNNISRIKSFNNIAFGGEKYQAMSLLQLQILQRYYFQTNNYQNVKAIARHMLQQRTQELFGPEHKNYICWPTVFCYDLQAKLYDDNMSWDKNVSQRWDQFGKLIENDSEVIVDDVRYPLVTLKNKNYLKEMKAKQPMKYGRLIKELEIKIRHYFKLLRIIFDRMDLTCKTGINIFRVLQNIFTNFFIPQIVTKELYADYFFYYLRFLCESVDCKWLVIEGEDQFNKGIVPIQKDTYRGVMANHMDRNYMKQRTANIVILMLENLDFVKCNFSYMIRALDTDLTTNKNFILKRLLVDIVVKNPVQNAWNLTFFKYYTLKLPAELDRRNRQSQKRVKKLQPLKKYLYDEDSQANTRFDAIIKSLYDEISDKIGEEMYQQLVQIPQMFLEILETNACNVAGYEHFYYEDANAISSRVKQINRKIDASKWRIPYPLDTRLWIKSVYKFEILGAGKSTPTKVQMGCRSYAEIKIGDLYKNEKNFVQTQANDLYKSFILKYNFSKADFMVETSTANFFNEFGMLDKDITYAITNMSKYILIIEKILVPHHSLKQLFEMNCGIDFRALDKEALNYSRKHDIRATQNPDRAPDIYPAFYDHMKSEKHNPLAEEGERITLFRAFYRMGIEKWRNAEQWWNYINNFVRTLAQWSYLCCLTKLGDRHNGNILVSQDGKVIHIDYEYNFAQGLVLPLPEWAAFRLTDAMVTALGIFKERGPFFGYFMDMARRFDSNEEKTWKALANFLPEQIKFIESTSKFENQDEGANLQQRCEKVIDTARSDSLLRLMYRGWLPSL